MIKAVRPNKNGARLGHRGWGWGHVIDFCSLQPTTKGMAEARDSSAYSVCSAFDAPFSKLLWPFVSVYV